MIRIPLDDAQARRLEQAFLQTTDRKVRDRLQVVRMAHRSRSHQDIAADLGVSPRTVQRWLNAYLQGGLAALKPRKAKGHPPAIPPHLASVIRRWVIEGPVKQGLDRANWTHAELADHLHKKAEAGELVLLSQDEARFPMVATLAAALGVKGFRLAVGTRDCKDLLYVLAVVNIVTAAVHSTTLESPARAKQKTGRSKTRRMQEAFAAFLRHVGQTYAKEKHKRVVLIIDNAPWHRGKRIDEALADNPHLEFKRLPSYSPQLNVIEHFWKLLRRRATHNRLFETLKDLKGSIRASLCYFQTVMKRIRGLVAKYYLPPDNRTTSAGL